MRQVAKCVCCVYLAGVLILVGYRVEYMDDCVHEMERQCVRVSAPAIYNSESGAACYVIDPMGHQLGERGKRYL